MAMTRREKLLAGLETANLVGVEIGALTNPFIRREDGEVIYVDHATRDCLVAKYRNDPSVNVDNIVHVDAVWGGNTLEDAVQGRKVDYVVASHVIEHVPDMITWLREIRRILKETGTVRLIIPDRRFSFDFLREESRLADLVSSYLVRARIPQPHSILDFALNVADVDCQAAWEGAIDPEKLKKTHRPEGAINLARDVLDHKTYHDVHCWVFTPRSFARLMRQLADIGLLDFACESFYDTALGTLDFFVSLRPSDDSAYIDESWKHMEHEVIADLPKSQTDNPAKETIAHLEEEVANLQTKFGASLQENLNLAEETRTARSELAVAKSLLETAQTRVADLEASTSWRITRPLRSAVTQLRRR